MPQLDISSYFSQLFWLFITFGILLFFISRYFLPIFNTVMRDRNNFISSNQEDVRKTEAKIEEIRQNYTNVINDAKFAAQGIIADANTALTKLHDDALTKLSDSVRVMHEENNKKMQNLVSKITPDIEKLCFDLFLKYHTALFSEKLGDKKINDSEVMAVILQYVQRSK